jgi:hypothetical protein
MIAVALALVLQAEAPARTPAIYRFPAKEESSRRLQELIDEEGFNMLCVDPKPGARVTEMAKGKLKFIDPKMIDTRANMKWRDATIEFAAGRISPKEWLKRTKGLKETVHFLTSPKTKELRPTMGVVPVPSGGTYSARAVFAELFLLSQPGVPCLTSSDTWKTRDLPDAGRLQSWILAMNDLCGPMLYYRFDKPFLVTGKPVILRADDKPGLLILRQTKGEKSITFFFNNSHSALELPSWIDMSKVTINRGIDMDSPKPKLWDAGMLILDSN